MLLLQFCYRPASSGKIIVKYASVPFNQNSNGWLREAPVVNPTLRGDCNADWVIIGAGFAGLAFARRLASHRPDLKIVLVDAASAAESSSARNSGFAIGLPHNIGSSTAELKKAQDYRSLLQAGIVELEKIVADRRIECEWEKAGKYHCQADPRSESVLQEYRENLDLMNEPYQILDREALAQKLGTHFYHKGIYTPGAVLLNPAALVIGLAATLPENVILHDNTPVMAIHYGRMNRILTPFGTLSAPKVMLATAALSSELTPGISKQAAMATFASLSEPLSKEQQQRLPESSWGLTPVNAIAGATLRYTRDRRILIRQHVVPALRGCVTAAQTYAATQLHRATFDKIYPQLKEVRLAHSWSGTISVTRNGAPIWGAISNAVYTASGCNGAGVSKQTIAGLLLADYALGYNNPLVSTMLALGQANFLPPSPLLDAAIAGSLLKERWLGRREV